VIPAALDVTATVAVRVSGVVVAPTVTVAETTLSSGTTELRAPTAVPPASVGLGWVRATPAGGETASVTTASRIGLPKSSVTRIVIAAV
jgi:hypothetical protein